ncbi:hypothetical protein GALMADRAFT_232843 [Galerina marginata CBS 339.88]|uniref:DRBM domain-containing protein n=1 Tax=Galerina marginata (strain CBS 339.88) TaxID=685588 RepID=A0A067S4T6_GALM3|nr:hypothetical protein GALMADRAFT_232843 [Galerina marginata CBS 339.88]
MDDCISWKAFHSNVVEHFKDPKKVGHTFMQKGQYEIEDAENNVVMQEDWKPKQGMLLSIALILTFNRRSLSAHVMCPYCDTIIKNDKITSESALTCKRRRCNRQFVISDSDSYRLQQPAVFSSLQFGISTTFHAEHPANSNFGDVFRKVRLVFPSLMRTTPTSQQAVPAPQHDVPAPEGEVRNNAADASATPHYRNRLNNFSQHLRNQIRYVSSSSTSNGRNAPVWKSRVYIDDIEYASGIGGSESVAKEAAASQALAELHRRYPGYDF